MRASRKILVVDDNPISLEAVTEFLENAFHVLVASSGRDAIEIARQYHPPVVLLDVMLPDIDGYEVCRRLRQLPNMRDSRIIMVSAKAMPSECAAGFSAGADAYLTKPFDDVELLETIREQQESRLEQ